MNSKTFEYVLQVWLFKIWKFAQIKIGYGFFGRWMSWLCSKIELCADNESLVWLYQDLSFFLLFWIISHWQGRYTSLSVGVDNSVFPLMSMQFIMKKLAWYDVKPMKTEQVCVEKWITSLDLVSTLLLVNNANRLKV